MNAKSVQCSWRTTTESSAVSCPLSVAGQGRRLREKGVDSHDLQCDFLEVRKNAGFRGNMKPCTKVSIVPLISVSGFGRDEQAGQAAVARSCLLGGFEGCRVQLGDTAECNSALRGRYNRVRARVRPGPGKSKLVRPGGYRKNQLGSGFSIRLRPTSARQGTRTSTRTRRNGGRLYNLHRAAVLL
jgi:hypothetical protein